MFDDIDLLLGKVYKSSWIITSITFPTGYFTGESLSILLAIIASIIATITGIARYFMKRKEHKRNMEIMDLEIEHIRRQLKKEEHEND